MAKYKDYDGSGFPSELDTNQFVEAILRNGSALVNEAGIFDWSWMDSDPDNDIVSYRVLEKEEE